MHEAPAVNVEGRLEVLGQIPYFRLLPPPELQVLAARMHERQYQSRDVIFRKGDPPDGLYIVLAGRVKTVVRSADGREQVLKVFGPGRTFGDIPVFDDEPSPADAVAVVETTILVVPQADLFDILRRHPDSGIEVIRLFASRLRAYKLIVEDLALRTVVSRVARLLVDRARGADTLVEEAASVSLRYTQDDVAEMVGSVREVVQRALKTLEDAGLIKMFRGRVEVIDVGALGGWIDSESGG